jgi:hypothetical protein
MADSYSSILRLRLQQTGANNNTWGGLLNSAAIQLIEDALAGRVAITVTTTDITLSTANGATDQARMAVLALSGSPGAPKNIVCPAVSKFYLVSNGTDAAMTLKTPGAGTGIAVPSGVRQYLYCDGTNVVEVQAAATGAVSTATNALNLGGIPAASYARLDAENIFTKGVAYTFVEDADGTTITVDCAAGKHHHVTLGGNRTIDINGEVDGAELELWLKQDAGGNRTVTWPGNVSFEGGVVPTLSTAANATDRFQGTYYAATTSWIMRPGQNVGAGSSTTVNVQQGGANLKMFDLAGRPGGVVNLAITINYGVVITSMSPREPALDLTGFTAGSTLTITNRGRILARGGRAGKGGGIISAGDDYAWAGTPGEAGGDAIRGPGAGITCTIANIEGYIWGGGGGGGGGGATAANGSACSGGGGGGGAPLGMGGDGGQTGESSTYSTGGIGASATMDTGGAGGAAGTSTGSGTGGAGGAGGSPGSAGANGAAPTGSGFNAPAGAGGATGKAIELNGGAVTVSSGSTPPNLYGAVS